MRTRIPLIVISLFLTIAAGYSQPGRDRVSSAFFLQDYTAISVWDSELNRWEASTRQVAVYNERNRLIESVAINDVTGDTISKTTSTYNDQGRVEIQLYSELREGEWYELRYLYFEYDEFNRRTSVTTYIREEGEWVFSSRARQYNLIYDENDRLLSYESQHWIDGEWQTTAIDYNEYDELGDRVYQLRRLMPSGQKSYQVFYTYMDNKMLTRHVQSWNRSTGEWVDSYRDQYHYDQCGLRSDFIRQRIVGGQWANSQKTEYFYRVALPYGTAQRDRKVEICHNGRTIMVSENAVAAHLAHGDCLGPCPDEQSARNRAAETERERQFTIYPNPARETATLDLRELSERDNIRRVEIADSRGNRLRTINVRGETELTIARGSLPAGNYYIRLVGSRGEYSAVLIFQ